MKTPAYAGSGVSQFSSDSRLNPKLSSLESGMHYGSLPLLGNGKHFTTFLCTRD